MHVSDQRAVQQDSEREVEALLFDRPPEIGVVGDAAVGLSGVLAAKKLGAGRIIALSRNPARQAVARQFGATDIVEERGADAVATVLRLTRGAGVDAALECVGTDQSIATCAGIVRAGGMIGAVGVPLYEGSSTRRTRRAQDLGHFAGHVCARDDAKGDPCVVIPIPGEPHGHPPREDVSP